MLEENIKAVKEAEIKAEEMLAEARTQAEKIIEASGGRIRDLQIEAENEAKTAEEALLARAEEMGEEHKAGVRAETERELAALRTMAEAKQDQAVDLVIKELI